MGDPRKIKAKYSGPAHPWQRQRLEDEKVLVREYGLKTKKELWKADSKVKALASQAKRLTALRTSQSDTEKKQLLAKVSRLGLLPSTASLDDVLALTVKDILERRLQTLVRKKGFAKTSTQARQFISHEHICIGDKKVSAPGYIVLVSEESQITFIGKSTLANPEHPERTVKGGKK